MLCVMRVKSYLFAGSLLALFLLAFATRYAVLSANVEAVEGDLPFTLESAIQFRMTERVYEGEGIPVHEPTIQHPEGIDVFRTDTVLAEYIYAGLARLMPDSIPLSTRVRWIMIAWFSLAAPLMAWWIRVWTDSRMGGVIAGAFFAVSLSAVIRSAGIEVSRETLALPLLLLHLGLAAWTERRLVLDQSTTSVPRSVWLGALGSALSLGLALAAWDMIQFYALLWLVYFTLRVIREPSSCASRFLIHALPGFALLLVAVISPYHRAHGLWAGPVLLIFYGLLLQEFARRKGVANVIARSAIACAPLLLFIMLPHGYGASYGHFGELLVAKIRFLNQKPVDPALLTFNQRIMWVPALDSATWRLTWMLFPAMLILVLVSCLAAKWSRPRDPRLYSASPLSVVHLFFCLAVSFVAYILFVRFHIYLALFAAASLGWSWAQVWQSGRWTRYVLAAVMPLGLAMEAAQIWEDPGRWGRPNVYYRELAEITEWLRDSGMGRPVLANFGVSGSLWAYGGSPVILHPKFESPDIRERVESYGTTLFTKDEEAFRDWADEHGAYYYVYALGEFATQHPELQMRYFVDALVPPHEAAARRFEYEPDQVRYFEYKLGNRKYRLFRVIPRADEARADQLTIYAEQALGQGDLLEAERQAWAALALFPSQYRAQEVIRVTTTLREEGFEYMPELRNSHSLE